MAEPHPDLLVPHFPFPYLTPNTPDLGCFVEQKHNWEQEGSFLFAGYPMLAGDTQVRPHQCYFRVLCGHAAFFQRVKVTMQLTLDPSIYFGVRFDYVLGGDFRPYPSDWLKYPPQQGDTTYFFRGECRDPSEANWQTDSNVEHKTDVYENGFLDTVAFDDAAADGDFNDIILEVAIVYRQPYFKQFASAETIDEAAFKEFVETQLPNINKAARPQRP
jgi:hypothetical protein